MAKFLTQCIVFLLHTMGIISFFWMAQCTYMYLLHSMCAQVISRCIVKSFQEFVRAYQRAGQLIFRLQRSTLRIPLTASIEEFPSSPGIDLPSSGKYSENTGCMSDIYWCGFIVIRPYIYIWYIIPSRSFSLVGRVRRENRYFSMFALR